VGSHVFLGVSFKKLWLLDSGIYQPHYVPLKIYLCAILGTKTEVVDYCLPVVNSGQFQIPFLIMMSMLFHKKIYWLWSMNKDFRIFVLGNQQKHIIMYNQRS